MPTSVLITSPTNSRIKEARKLQRRRQRYEQGALLIEGLRLVRDAWSAGAELYQFFYVEEQLHEQPDGEALLAEVQAGGVELLPCTPTAFAALSETVTPQGIAAVAALPNLPLPLPRDLILILDQVRDPGNAGTLLRTAEAAGVDLVLFGPETVDPFNDKVLRAGMGAHFRQPLRACARWDAVTEILLPGQPLYLAEAAAILAYDAVDWTAPAALIVGGEAAGASAPARRAATPIAIPMHGATESLNAAIAGAVMLFEAARQRRSSEKFAGGVEPR